MSIHSTSEEAHDLDSGLALARPDKRFLTSYIEALHEGLDACRHSGREKEIEALQNCSEETWKKFSEIHCNGPNTENTCMEDMFWLTKQEIFIGFIMLRTELGPLREKYGGTTGRVFRPSERGKGYGTIGLELTKALAKNRGFEELVMVTSKDNIAAQKPWEKCGATIVEKFDGPIEGYYSNGAIKYKITL